MARRIVDYLFKVSKDDVGPRFAAMERAERGLVRQSRRDSLAYARNWKKALSSVSNQGNRKFKALENRSRSLAGKISSILAILGVSAAVKKGVGGLSDLESQMSGLAITLGVPLEKLKGLRREIEDFSTLKGIEQSATEIAESLNTVVGANIPLKQSLDLVKEMAKASSAVHANLSVLTGGVLIAVGARPELLKEPKTTIGKILVLKDIGGIEIEDSAPALGATTAPAQKAKISFDEQLVLLAALSTAGVDKPQVGTAIARMLDRITREEFRKGARKFGVNVLTEDGKLKSSIEIINLVGDKFKTLKTQPQEQKLIKLLFSSGDVRAEKGFITFFNKVKDLKSGLKKIKEKGPTQISRAMAERVKELDATLDRIGNNIDFLSRDFGELFRGPLESIERATSFILPKKGEKTPSEKFFDNEQSKPEPFSFVPGGGSVLGLIFDKAKAAQVDLIRSVFRSDNRKKNVPQLGFLERKVLNQDLIVVKPTVEFKPKINTVVHLDPLSGKTKTTVTVDQTAIERRMPTGATP